MRQVGVIPEGLVQDGYLGVASPPRRHARSPTAIAAVGFDAEMVRHRGSKPGIRTTGDDTENSGHQNLLTRCRLITVRDGR